MDSSRRSFLATLGSLAAAPLLARDFSPGAPPVRYPEPDVIVLNKERFGKIKVGNAPIERLHTGMKWAEGPAWSGAGQYLVWSDIPNDQQLRWLADDGHVSTIHKPAGFSNGSTFDREWRQISCEHLRRVVRYEPNGTLTVLAEKYDGKPLNAPNDVVVAPDGGIWFTDPGYGALFEYEGKKQPLQQKEAVYRIDAATGKIERVTDEIFKPNGLCFSPDYKKLYVADTGSSHYPEAPKNIKVWDVDGTKLKNGREFCSMKMKKTDVARFATEREPAKLPDPDAPKQDTNVQADPTVSGVADGIRCDVEGNVWAGAGWVGAGYDGVHIFAPDGERTGLILLPEICSNVCFGGPRRNRLFMTASQSLYAVYVETSGAHFC